MTKSQVSWVSKLSAICTRKTDRSQCHWSFILHHALWDDELNLKEVSSWRTSLLGSLICLGFSVHDAQSKIVCKGCSLFIIIWSLSQDFKEFGWSRKDLCLSPQQPSATMVSILPEIHKTKRLSLISDQNWYSVFWKCKLLFFSCACYRTLNCSVLRNLRSYFK